MNASNGHIQMGTRKFLPLFYAWIVDDMNWREESWVPRTPGVASKRGC